MLCGVGTGLEETRNALVGVLSHGRAFFSFTPDPWTWDPLWKAQHERAPSVQHSGKDTGVGNVWGSLPAVTT